MNNRFGAKDLLLIVLGFLTLGILLISMVQEDRRFAETKNLEERVTELLGSVGRLQRNVDSMAASGGNAADTAALAEMIERTLQAGGGSAAASDSAVASDGLPVWAFRDEPGEVTLPRRWGPIDDPTDDPGFAMGGVFTETFEARMTKLTPFVFSDVYGRRVVREVVCEQLANYNPDTLEFEGFLAEAWQYADDGLRLRVKIRDEARWSDGMPLTAEDVRFTFMDYIKNPEIEAENIRSTMPQIENVVVISDKVVDFIFNEAIYTNLDVAMRYSILPKHFYEQFTPSEINSSTALLMGSGPYRLESLDPDNQWTPGTMLVLVRNTNYWGARPPISEHRFNVITENTSRLTAFENGNTDMVRGTSEQYATKIDDAQFRDIGTPHAWTNMKSGYTFIAWNNGERNGKLTPFHDARVRRAMTHLLDRERINRDFYEGLATVAYGPFNPETKQCNPNLSPLPYNMEEAERLLAEAGWIDRDDDGILENEAGDEFTFDYTHSTGSSLGPKVGAYLKDQCARVGIRCNIDMVEWSILVSKMDDRNFDAITLAWSQSAPESDPRQLWHTEAIINQGYNFVQYRNERVDELIDEGRATLDLDERTQVWHQVHEEIHRDQPYTFLLFVPWIRFVSNDVENFHEYAVGIDKHAMWIADN